MQISYPHLYPRLAVKHADHCQLADGMSVLDLQEDGSTGYGRPNLGRKPCHSAGLVGVEWLFHLHGLEYDDEVPRGHGLTLGDCHLDDRSLHRHLDVAAATSATVKAVGTGSGKAKKAA